MKDDKGRKGIKRGRKGEGSKCSGMRRCERGCKGMKGDENGKKGDGRGRRR